MAWIEVGSVEELERQGVITVRGADRQIAVFWNEGEPRAVDNRCPHMGFPLSQGTVKDGVLTCHWHHARFALKGGCAFDLFADDVPTFELGRENGRLSVRDTPSTTQDRSYYETRLRRGLEQNLMLIQSKSIIGLLKSGAGSKDIIRQLVEFGCENHDTWMDGMNLLGLMARLDPVLSERTRIHGLSWAASRLGQNCAGQPRRRERGALSGADEPFERLLDWFRQFTAMRARDGAERALLSANLACANDGDRQRILALGILQRVYLATGHVFDFANKALELGEYLDANNKGLWPNILPLLVPDIVQGQGEEDRGAWRTPVDLVSLVRAAEAECADIKPGNLPLKQGIRKLLLSDNPHDILSGLVTELRAGVNPVALGVEIAMAAGWRLARLSPSVDLGDWFSPVHTFIYANAAVQALKRAPAGELLPSLLQGAMAVYQDRFLNVPAAPYPIHSAEEAPGGPLLEQLLQAMDRAPDARAVVEMTVRWVRGGGSLGKLTDTLCWATVREDLDFHKLQVIEAAWALSKEVSNPEDQALLFAGAARYLALHCPTPRTRRQTVKTAEKLHRD